MCARGCMRGCGRGCVVDDSPILAVSNSQPDSVTTIVCSNCADRVLKGRGTSGSLRLRVVRVNQRV